MNQLTEIALVGAWGAAIVLDKALPPILKYVNGKKNGNGSSEKPVEYWQHEFREAVKETMAPFEENQTRIMEAQTQALNRVIETQHQQALILTELVTLQRISHGVGAGEPS